MEEIEKKLNYTFCDKSLLKTALTHSSYANEHGCKSNERLEFVGDSVLGMIVARYLFATYPDQSEGALTKLRAELVCEGSLWAVADRLSFGAALRLGRGEAATGGRQRHSILADCVEAVIAAMYLDGGMTPAEGFVMKHILAQTKKGSVVNSDFKTELQELVQKVPGRSLTYTLAGESGPDHNKEFSALAMLDGKEIGQGRGRTKKEAEQNAAKRALEELKKQ